MKGPRCAPRSVEEGGLLGATRLNPGGFGFQKKVRVGPGGQCFVITGMVDGEAGTRNVGIAKLPSSNRLRGWLKTEARIFSSPAEAYRRYTEHDQT